MGEPLPRCASRDAAAALNRDCARIAIRGRFRWYLVAAIVVEVALIAAVMLSRGGVR